MGIRITDTTMTATRSGHTATRGANGRWSVTGHPGRAFTRNQAVTALTLAEALATNPPPADRMWWHINDWRAELDLPPLSPTTHPARDAASSAKTPAAPRHTPQPATSTR
ncbi:hypothetical protein FH608_024090 [Nonomuraea phyllanthi]|uniref:Uncharacterized protein n=1 Tax=Nonomuraea phyllanthi TaxID=2219224 RepID=A0A5C4W905_9ACTN|nr:hypothetical protein [Nonomuraea phyllanthi]KAB8192585.1 hypothetical protein FH608_024090 [Nonomuraea phyllanthi]